MKAIFVKNGSRKLEQDGAEDSMPTQREFAHTFNDFLNEEGVCVFSLKVGIVGVEGAANGSFSVGHFVATTLAGALSIVILF